MKQISQYSNVGDSLSGMHFNFACLDIRACNIQHYAVNKYSKIFVSEWEEAFTQATEISSQWESVKEQVHNASAYWGDQVITIVYPQIFKEGTASIGKVFDWLRVTFPANLYVGRKADVIFYEWRKRPPSGGVHPSSFGKMSLSNNVFIKAVHHVSFKSSGTWRPTNNNNSILEPKPVPDELDCGECWGNLYYPEIDTCIQRPLFYKLEALSCDEPEPPVDPCEILDDVDIEWEFPVKEEELLTNYEFQILSATDLVPYVIGKRKASNPDQEEVSENVYKKYINNSSEPNLPDSFNIERVFAYNLEYTYDYDSTTDEFTKSSIISSDDMTFLSTNDIDFPIKIQHLDIIKFMQAYGLNGVLHQLDPNCSFQFRVTSKWYRWVTDNTALSASPYWHIGIENGDSSLGFTHDPKTGTPDPSGNWITAETALGDSLSAFFGTQYDMMGEVINVEIL